MTKYTVATFNLKNDMPLTRRFLRWSTRKSAVLACITEMDADILGVQEATDEMLEAVSTLNEVYDKVGIPRNNRPKSTSERTDIFYKKNKFTCLYNETFWLSGTPNKPGSKTLLSPFPRICTYAKLQDRATGEILNVFNTHLCHLLPYTRNKTMKILLNHINDYQLQGNIILLGDLNTNSDSTTVRHVLNHQAIPLKSVYPNHITMNTMHFGNGHLNPKDLPIDYIFVSKDVVVHHTKIVIEKFENMYPSDHFPVVTTLSIK